MDEEEWSIMVPCSGSNLNDMGLVWYDALRNIQVICDEKMNLKNVTLWCGITKLCTAVMQSPGIYKFSHDCTLSQNQRDWKLKPMKIFNTAYFETRGPLQLFYSPSKTQVTFSCNKLIFPMETYRRMVDYYYIEE